MTTFATPTRPSGPRPLVLVSACNRVIGEHRFHVAGHKYVEAVRLAGCQPLVVPDAAIDEVEPLLDLAHGVLLTGSRSNVHPRHYAQDIADVSLPLDPERDAWTLPLILRALARGIPLFAICRGFQEANVALGGSLHQAVHEVAERQDHRAPTGGDADVQYGPAHEVAIQPGGVLERLLGCSSIQVNSVHGQGISRLAAGLRIEALAPDGLIEACSVEGASGFNLAVQWHPEWQAAGNPVSLRLFTAFGRACAAHRDRHRTPRRELVPER